MNVKNSVSLLGLGGVTYKTKHCQLNTLLSIQQARTMKPRRGRQADPATKRCQATRSPEGGASDLRLIGWDALSEAFGGGVDVWEATLWEFTCSDRETD